MSVKKYCEKCNLSFNNGLYLTKCPICKSQIHDKIKNAKIKEILVEKLFNEHDYKINFDTNKNISILTAPNGFGKSTIFKFLEFMFDPTVDIYNKIKNIPIKKFQCTMTDGTKVTYEKLSDAVIKKFNNPEIITKFKEHDDKIKKNNERISFHKLKPIYESLLKSNVLFDDDYFETYCYSYSIENKNSKQKINFLELLENAYQKNSGVMKETLKSTKADITDFIKSNNDYKSLNIKSTRTNIEGFKLELTSIINYFLGKKTTQQEKDDVLKKFQDYLSEPNCLTSYRMKMTSLLKSDIYLNLLPKDIKLKILQDKNLLKNFNFDEYLSSLDTRIKMFSNIFNYENSLTNKSIDFFEKDGFVITQNRKPIFVDNLSTGEKNLFVIYFNLIFNTNQSTIFLIDEPEISLHIEWQENMINHMKKIAELDNVQIIIATHSPNILNGHTELLAEKEVSEINGQN